MPRSPSRPIPIRIKKDQLERLQLAAEKLGLHVQDVIRLTADIGLTTLEKIDYKVVSAVMVASESRDEKHEQSTIAARSKSSSSERVGTAEKT